MKILVIGDKSLMLGFLRNYLFSITGNEELKLAPLIMPVTLNARAEKMALFNRKTNNDRIRKVNKISVSRFRIHWLTLSR